MDSLVNTTKYAELYRFIMDPLLNTTTHEEIDPYELTVDDDTCVLVAGLINTDWLPSIIFTHKNVKHKIISLWDSTSNTNVELLRESGFKVIINKESEFTHIRAKRDVCVWTGINKCKEF